MTYILGINAYHPDVSVVLIKDGELIAGVKEERFKRIKHWIGFPDESIQECLDIAGITREQIDHVAISRDPRANIWRKILFVLKKRPSLGLVKNRLKNTGYVLKIESIINDALKLGDKKSIPIHYVEHHPATYPAPFLCLRLTELPCWLLMGLGTSSVQAWQWEKTTG